MNATTPFRAGQRVVVRPSDSDDPDALARAGQSAVVLRQLDAPGGVSRYVRVRFATDDREQLMRAQDLAPAEAS